MAKAYQFLRGYYFVEAKGNHLEKLLNLALTHRIYLWDVKRLDNGTISFYVSNRGFSMMEEYAKTTDSEMKILSREGAGVLWRSTKKRKVFLASFLVLVAVILISSSFIWTVEISGGEFMEEARVKEQLSSYGLGVGKLRKNVDFTRVSNQLIQDFEEILWANVELHGTKLTVTLVPRTQAPQVIPKDIPTNIVAKKDGVILEITAENGDALVKAGDTVVKDQILISGLIPSPTVGTRYLHSIGAIQAITWEEKTIEQKLYRYDKIPTGNRVIHRELELPFLKIPLDFHQTIDFYNYDSIIKEKNFMFLTYREIQSEEYTLQKNFITQEQAVEEAVKLLSQQLAEEGIENIISQKVTFQVLDEETLLVTLLAQCEEELGISREITKPSTIQ